MKSLKILLINTIEQSFAEPYSFSSEKFDLNFIKHKKIVYFILSKKNESYLTGSVKKTNNDLSFKLNKKNSSWLMYSSEINAEKAIEMLYETYVFMSPVSKIRIKH